MERTLADDPAHVVIEEHKNVFHRTFQQVRDAQIKFTVENPWPCCAIGVAAYITMSVLFVVYLTFSGAELLSTGKFDDFVPALEKPSLDHDGFSFANRKVAPLNPALSKDPKTQRVYAHPEAGLGLI